MSNLTKHFVALIIFILVVGNISAQSNEQPLLVVSFQKIKLADIAKSQRQKMKLL